MIRIPPVVTLDQQETDQTSIWKKFLEQIELSTTNHFISVFFSSDTGSTELMKLV
jgi:hypothetical protein